MRKPVFGVSGQVRHKPGCIATESGERLEISDLVQAGSHYPCNEKKGADQLRGYREADLRLCFRICQKRFSHDAAHLKQSTNGTLIKNCEEQNVRQFVQLFLATVDVKNAFHKQTARIPRNGHQAVQFPVRGQFNRHIIRSKFVQTNYNISRYLTTLFSDSSSGADCCTRARAEPNCNHGFLTV